MGDLIRVELRHIPKSWNVKLRTHIRDTHYFEGEVVDTYSVTELWVEFPKSGWANSYSPDHLVIEASNVEHVSELLASGVPFQSTADLH